MAEAAEQDEDFGGLLGDRELVIEKPTFVTLVMSGMILGLCHCSGSLLVQDDLLDQTVSQTQGGGE